MQSAALAGVLTVSRNYSRISFAPFGEQKFFRDSYIYEVPRQNFVLVSFADIFVGGYSRFLERFFPAVFIELFVPAVEDTAVLIREFYYFTDIPVASRKYGFELGGKTVAPIQSYSFAAQRSYKLFLLRFYLVLS